MRASEPTRKEVRQARAFLHRRGITVRKMDPHRFAAAARDMNLTFGALFDRLTARMEALRT